MEFDQGICDERERREERGEGFYDGGGERIRSDVIHTSTRKTSWKNVEEGIIC